MAAAALKCLGGAIQGRLVPRDDDERAALVAEGYDLDQSSGSTTSWPATTRSSRRPA